MTVDLAFAGIIGGLIGFTICYVLFDWMHGRDRKSLRRKTEIEADVRQWFDRRYHYDAVDDTVEGEKQDFWPDMTDDEIEAKITEHIDRLEQLRQMLQKEQIDNKRGDAQAL